LKKNQKKMIDLPLKKDQKEKLERKKQPKEVIQEK
jgi:hypothetical protein